MATHVATRNISGLARALAQHGVMSEHDAEALQSQAQTAGVTFVEQMLSGKRMTSQQLALFGSRAFGIPLFDLLLVMFIRWRKGIPMTKGSPDHFALRLRRCNLSIRETTVTTYIVGLLLGFVAILMSNIQFGWALAAVGGTMSVAALSAYLLLKVDMHS